MTGKKEAHKPEQYYSMPFAALREVAKVYRYGSGKYGPYNYLNGYAYSLSIDALFRHLMAWLDEDDRDVDESGYDHMAHVAWHALNLLNMNVNRDKYEQYDDRQGTLAARNVYSYYEAEGFHNA